MLSAVSNDDDINDEEETIMRQIETLDQIPATGTALMYLGTTWCPHCKSTVAAIGEVLGGRDDVEVVRIDGDDEPDALTWVGAKTYPQLLLYRDGAKVAQRESADADRLRAWLAEHGAA